MRDNEQRSLRRFGIGRDFVGARQKQLRYQRIIAHGFAICPNLSVRWRRNRLRQIELPRYYRLGEITLADEIRDNENFADNLVIKKKSRVAQARFLFPERTLHIGKNSAAPNLMRVVPCGCARIRIHGRSVADNEKSAAGFRNHRGWKTLNRQRRSSNT